MPVPLVSIAPATGPRLHQLDLFLTREICFLRTFFGSTTRTITLVSLCLGLVLVTILSALVGSIGHSHILGDAFELNLVLAVVVVLVGASILAVKYCSLLKTMKVVFISGIGPLPFPCPCARVPLCPCVPCPCVCTCRCICIRICVCICICICIWCICI